MCRKPVAAGGYLEFVYSEWHANRAASAAWEERHRHPVGGTVWNVGDGDDPPGYVPWHVLHAACDPAPDRNDAYWVDIPRTWKAVAGLTAHLHGKAWFPATDWGPLLYRVGAR